MMYEEIVKAVSNAAAIFKLVCGVGNNAAWLAMLDGYDQAKRCKAFRRSLKGGHMVGWYFKKAVNDFKDYERQLLTTEKNRMFHVADMTEDVRRKYGNISDAQYYEFWKGVGGVAYAKTKLHITSLWNKYRVSLVKHDVKDAEHVAWVGCRARRLGNDSPGRNRPVAGDVRECHEGMRNRDEPSPQTA